MSVKLPVVLGADGRPQQLQSGDTLEGIPGPTLPTLIANAHFVNPGAVVYLVSAATMDLALADGAGGEKAVGLLPAAVNSGEPGAYQQSGELTLATGLWDNVTGGSGGLTPGDTYYLDDSSPGRLVATAPSTVGHFVVVIGIALSTTRLLIRLGEPVLL